MDDGRLIIVEGTSDKKRLQKILDEPVEIICTNGTVSFYHLEEILEPYEQWELFVFLDADASGEKIRALFKREYPQATHLYTEKVYGQVETTPYHILASTLLAADFKIRHEFLL